MIRLEIHELKILRFPTFGGVSTFQLYLKTLHPLTRLSCGSRQTDAPVCIFGLKNSLSKLIDICDL